MTLVSRNPFAREELHRDKVVLGPIGNTSCSWCGRVLENYRQEKFLYRYRVETDSGRVCTDPRLFCSMTCRKNFYGL
jgi:hypothetical protein